MTRNTLKEENTYLDIRQVYIDVGCTVNTHRTRIKNDTHADRPF